MYKSALYLSMYRMHDIVFFFSSFVSLYMCDCRVQLTQKGEVFLNLVMEFVPEMLYRIARHYSKSKQTIPLIYIKVGVTGWWHYFSFLESCFISFFIYWKGKLGALESWKTFTLLRFKPHGTLVYTSTISEKTSCRILFSMQCRQ